MSFNYRVVWIDPQKQKQKYIDVGSNMAIFIAQRKVSEGMLNVVIQVYEDAAGEDDLPPIDAEVIIK